MVIRNNEGSFGVFLCPAWERSENYLIIKPQELEASGRSNGFHDFFSAAHGSAWPRSGRGIAEGSEYGLEVEEEEEPGAADMTGVDERLGGGGGGPMASSCC